MRKFFTTTLLLTALTGAAFIPDNMRKMKVLEVVGMDTTGVQSILVDPDYGIDRMLDAQFDELLHSWYVRTSYKSAPQSLSDDGPVTAIPDSVYIRRLQAIDSPIDMSFNPTVKTLIEFYTQRRRDVTEMILGLAQVYFPMIEEELNAMNLPLELKYMAVIESALNPLAKSRVKAVGLWQFMFSTGRLYDLEINSYIDERSDPVKSTIAAAKYMKELYDLFPDWHMVIAAYNCGPGNIKKAMRRSGGNDYWSIYYSLPKETRGHVPTFIAAAYTLNYYELHGLRPRIPDFALASDTVMVRDYLHLGQIAARMNVSLDELRALNPQYIIDVVPGRPNKACALRLPIEKIAGFIDDEGEIFAYKRAEYFPNNQIKIPQGRSTYSGGAVAGKDKVVYTVKSGDTPGGIAAKYHVKLADLREWNNLSTRSVLRIGQKLTIYTQKSATSTAVASATSSVDNSDPNYVLYTVQRDDTLWSIAQKFPDITSEDIKRLNNMSSNKIQPGQKLKIKTK
ncbi:MAG: LysM peptidoglycan-binding domain-containing protein [Bacteroidales bacterium]|jgi:membrane-bound lytic murein transglycosylase D|nr:LysM peptidoglycan-binding domain-containing protein [Bacteroidales bacterium]